MPAFGSRRLGWLLFQGATVGALYAACRPTPGVVRALREVDAGLTQVDAGQPGCDVLRALPLVVQTDDEKRPIRIHIVGDFDGQAASLLVDTGAFATARSVLSPGQHYRKDAGVPYFQPDTGGTFTIGDAAVPLGTIAVSPADDPPGGEPAIGSSASIGSYSAPWSSISCTIV